MGQIVGLNAKCKRANLNALGSVPTPANGELILVSSDNSMTSDGQGNFDCYIVGNGRDAATALPLENIMPLDVFDLSAHTGSTYADLAAALNAMNALPAAYKKGGMSVKFVQSSDNKYVQFRYMSSSTAVADFTNVANWQGIDDEPTTGSNNLVESGGVVKRINKYVGKIDVNISGKYIDRNGNIENAPGYIISKPFELKKSETISFTVTANDSTVLAEYNNGIYTVLVYQPMDTSIPRSYNYTATDDCNVVICGNTYNTYFGYLISNSIIATERDIELLKNVDNMPTKYSNGIVISGGVYKALYEEIRSINITSLDSPLIYQRKGYINYSGVFVPYDSYFVTLPFFVEKGQIVTYNFSALTMTYLAEATSGDDMPEDDTPYTPILKGNTSGEKSYVAPRDMWLVFSGARAGFVSIVCSKEEFIGVVPYVNQKFKELSEEKKFEETDIFTFNPPSVYDSLIVNAHGKKGNGTDASVIPPVTLGWFSDLHGDAANLDRLIRFIDKYGLYVDDILSTGDSVLQMWEDDYTFWDTANAGKVLQTVGNHDVWTHHNDPSLVDGLYFGSWYLVKQKNTYDRFIAPYVSEWGVTQPQDASVEGKCYYYKDYTYTNGGTTTTILRLIVLDCMHIQKYADLDGSVSKQITWFENVLTDAMQNSIPVVAAYHWLVGSLDRIEDCTFNSYDTALEGSNPKLAEKVEDFISNGGEFICWLTGHNHFDATGLLRGTSQLQLTIDTAGCSGMYSDSNRVRGTKTQDSFDIVTFDTTDKLVKVIKVGDVSNRRMQSKQVFVYRYKTVSEDKPAGLVLCR